MELLYEKKEAGLNDKTGDNANWNGNISAVKWRNFGAASGATDQRSYKYAYDKSDKLTTATFQTSTDLDWTKAVGTLNEQMTYDALFISIDAAAIDWGRRYNDNSIVSGDVEVFQQCGNCKIKNQNPSPEPRSFFYANRVWITPHRQSQCTIFCRRNTP
jgi:YD repeat-containing protein